MKKLTLLTIIILAITASLAYARREFTYDKNDKFSGNDTKLVKIDMPSGQIEIEKSSSNDIEVYYKNVIFASDQKEADDIHSEVKYKAETSGDKLTITVDMPKHGHHGMNVLDRIFSGNWNEDNQTLIKLRIPDDKDIEINSASADLRASDISMNLDFWSASSDIDLENNRGKINCNLASGDVIIYGNKGSISVKGVSSDIRLKDIEGNIEVSSTSGDGEIDRIKGSVAFDCTSGDLKFYDIDGDLDVRTISGDIFVDNVGGSVHASSTSGDIRLQAMTAKEGDFDVESVSGDISAEVSTNFTGSVAVNTSSGTISSRLNADFDKHTDTKVLGRAGDGKGRLSVSSASGDITLDNF